MNTPMIVSVVFTLLVTFPYGARLIATHRRYDRLGLPQWPDRTVK
jgi:hypothetical protein